MRASERDPARRFQTGLELAASLREALEDDGTLPATPVVHTTPTPTPTSSVGSSVPKRRIWLSALVVLLIVVGIGVVARAPAREPQKHAAHVVPVVPAAAAQPSKVEALTGFSLDSEPTGASVFVDGVALADATPVRLAGVAAGNHTVRVEKPGYRAHAFSLLLTAGAMLDLPKAVLEPQPIVQDVQAKSNDRAREPARPERELRNSEVPRPPAAQQAKPRLGKYDELIGF
jgi:hypothetical protein